MSDNGSRSTTGREVSAPGRVFRYSIMIRDLIRRARRRYIWNQLLAQGAYASSAGMAGVILLLLAGTQILDWPFLVAVSFLTLGIGSYRTIRRVPSAYVIAQLVDRRLLLADALSTALAFEEPDRKASASMRDGQRAQAEHAAGTAEIERAIPFAMPRAVYALAALGMVASGLFALRYGFTRSLDLRAPLARILMDTLSPANAERAALRKKAAKPDAQKPLGLTLPEGDPNAPAQLDPAPESALDTTSIPQSVNDPLPQNQGDSKAKPESASMEKADGERGDSESSDDTGAASGESLSDGPQGKKGNQKGASDTGKQERANAEQNSSLVSKLRDAMSNLLSKMRQQPNGSGSDHASNGGQSAKQAGAQRAGQKPNGASGEQPQPGGQESSDAENQQAGAEGKNGQNSQAKGAGHSSDQQAANQPGSGIGRQDGNKDTRLAEQVAAMGKISEIIGKRSANVSGEITVEVPSSQQQLHTPYSQSTAAHTDAGGDISRDEVPVIFQQYVQQYFEQVHKPSNHKPEITTRSKAQAPASKTQPPSL